MTKKSFVAAALALLTSSAFAQDVPGPVEPTYLYRAEVVRVIDGDTVDLDIDLGFYVWMKSQRIRLIDIDAPETKGDQKAAGLAAKAFLAKQIEGKRVILRTYKGKDEADRKGSFGRWLGRIYLNGEDINQMMMDRGYAVTFKE